MTDGSDEALVARIAGGDGLAMQALYGRHATRLYRFLVRLVRDPTHAEDLMSEVFLDVWRQAARYEGRASVTTWMLSIARFKALSHLRRRPQDSLEPEAAEAIEDEADTPEILLQKVGKAEAIRRCLATLSAEHREVVDLVYYHERSVEEVAEIVGIPAGTVKTRLFHARKRLSEQLSARGIDRGWP
ncbi:MULTISPECIES: sigma-70 family RNA polymerase sigma factor [Methylobacterium]|uniref:RNA polymerase sigma-H factor n=1 Tax=Methylobacterium jeotgali TaxID=381630 RepID=A0ABQ4ST42_9HYPH|nr:MULTISPECIES: sigma-70 family RNA polymerase sigma factor [Methylobacterium]PIU06045.1 MAG: RNA polymerase subunit sigma [Methylobacterium sp. CG09_land_8_20_14_0_10_71_15]PIU12552.1 MAG: RNA polymerase subunit sigma [Methylobacterium sp. CG08_land_8_20_14_0_20_71_15]GBU16281.1 RNA polymerase sigma factor [Methylobacterium sp.]GJE06392.1 RNA polymerase sigma-H factor [Methylobacterium jeotgali]